MKTTIEKEIFDIIGDNHQMTSAETPMRDDAFVKSDVEKMQVISEHFEIIMNELGLDLTDDSLKGTPANKPKISVFDNSYNYDKMLVEANISFNSTCEHHFLPIVGKTHIGYISSGKVIGLSKLNRIVDYYAKRPQVQERMIMQIFNELKTVLETEDVMVVVEAKHLCVSSRGIKDESSFTSTLQYGGAFNKKEFREDFYKLISKE
jgi:GTP cyclohydrolase IA